LDRIGRAIWIASLRSLADWIAALRSLADCLASCA
jgi:hypothetical protein